MTAVLLLGGLEVAVLCVLTYLPGAVAMPWPGLALWGVAFGAYGLVAIRLLSGDGTFLAPGGHGPGAGPAGDPPGLPAVAWIWVLGILARVLLLPAHPVLSDDIYRYVWDGWSQVRGLNPFLLAPAEAVETLGPLGGISDRINHPEVPTIYPPAAQLTFAALARISPSVPLFKTTFVLADLGVAWTVWRLASRDPSGHRDGTAPPGGAAAGNATAATTPWPAVALLLYLWCPLPIVEVAWSGHLEPLGVLPMMAAILVAGKRARAGGALLGLGAAVKWLPALGLPALARRRGPVAGAAGIVLLVLLGLPFVESGARLTEGLRTFAVHWEFNPGAFELLRAALGEGLLPRAVAGLAVVGVACAAAWRRWSVERTLYWSLGAALLLTPTLHPWYALWILPLAALRGGRTWILFAGLVALGYWGRDVYVATGTWPRPAWVGLAVHGPLAVGLLASALRGGRRG